MNALDVDPIVGSFSTEVDSGAFRHVMGAATSPRTTLTVTWRARWWKRPILWLLRRPTRWSVTYHDVVFTESELTSRGHVIEFEAGLIASVVGEEKESR